LDSGTIIRKLSKSVKALIYHTFAKRTSSKRQKRPEDKKVGMSRVWDKTR